MKKVTIKRESQLVQVKKIFLTLSFMFLVAISSVWATNEPTVNEEVKASFKKEFAGAQLIEWNDMGDYLKATFILGDHRTEAYFREDGHLEGTIRTLFYSQLPLVVMTSVDKRFINAEILEVSEVNNASGTTYRITLEVKHKKYNVRVDAIGNFSDIEKLKM